MNILNLKRELKIIIILFTIIMCLLIYIKIKQDTNQQKIINEKTLSLFSSIDKNSLVDITKYTIYGTHLNIEGSINILKLSGIKVSNVELVLKNINGDEIRY